jgi:hypothetical protein
MTGRMRLALRRGRSLLRAIRGTATGLGLFAAASAATILLSMRYEAALLPVVTEFEVDRISATADSVTLRASVAKARSCAFLGLDMMVGDPWDSARPRERLTVRFDTGDGSQTLEPGRQPIGPFTVSRPVTDAGPMAFLIVRHRCHPLWVTEGVYFMAQRDALFRQPEAPISSPCGAGE